jgi:hypothetical protein
MWLDFLQWQETFLFSKISRLALGPSQPYYVYPEGIDGSFNETERPGREVDYLTPHNAKIKTEWS